VVKVHDIPRELVTTVKTRGFGLEVADPRLDAVHTGFAVDFDVQLVQVSVSVVPLPRGDVGAFLTPRLKTSSPLLIELAQRLVRVAFIAVLHSPQDSTKPPVFPQGV
jgi:hypothetical protein